ncbi:MAG: hypothetical protein WC180_06465, partial [Candidatus Paceibacterota bacterium]
MLNKKLKKVIAGVTMFASVVCLSGVSMLAPLSVKAATTIVDGDIVKTNAVNSDGTPAISSLDVYIVKIVGTKMFKRLVLNPDIFESYGHLKWENLKVVSQAEIDAYTTSSLVRVDGNDKVYAITPVTGGDTGAKSWINVTAAQFLSLSESDPDSIYTINNVDGAAYSAKSDITTVAQLTSFYADGTLPGEVVGALNVSLSADTPVSNYVSKGAQNVLFAKFNLNAAGATTVSKVVLQRKGLGYDADIDTVRLYSGATQIGNDQSINTTDHTVTFSNLNWQLAAGATTFSVKANVNSAPAGTNDYFELVQIDSDATSSAGLPVAGNAMQFSNLSVGVPMATSVSGTQAVISGETGVELGCWNIETNATEGFFIDSLKFTNTGSSSSIESSNFSLKVSSTQVPGSSVAAMNSDGVLTFDLSASPYFIDKSTTKKMCVYGDITAGITTAKTLIFQLAETKDFVARGDNSGGEGLLHNTGEVTFTSQTAKTNNIGQGSSTLAQSASYAPATGITFVKGVANNKM